jgi:hypothetical protein
MRHSSVPPPDNLDARLWRYLSERHFRWLVENKRPGASVKKVIGAADCGEHRQAAEITTRLGDSWTMGFVYRAARERV